MKSLLIAILALFLVESQVFAQPTLRPRQIAPLDRMPLVPGGHIEPGGDPVAKRNSEYWYYLQASVRVINGSFSGSATMCHYDISTNTAYLISCGHLFSDKKRARPITCQVEVYYKNYERLPKPQRFPATVICYDSNQDISFMRFNPDWKPGVVFPIAPLSYPIPAGSRFESTGCDHAEEVAAYSVEIVGEDGDNLKSVNNSPRPGRSGGGLLSHDGYYLGIVWGTSDYSGSGFGYYVPLKRIHAYAKQFKETAWLLDVGKAHLMLNSIPTVDLEDRPVQAGSIPSP